MNETTAKKRMIYGAVAAALVLAGAFLLLQGKSKTVIFPEFSASDALNGSANCYLNELKVYDRYAEEPDKESPAELLLVGFSDRDDNEVLASLLVEPKEPLYTRLSAYYAQSENKTELMILSGYFFCEPMQKHNADAADAFEMDANAYIAWKGDPSVCKIPVVLRFAGETEKDYKSSIRKENLPNVLTVIVLFLLAFVCGIRIWTLRVKKAG